MARILHRCGLVDAVADIAGCPPERFVATHAAPGRILLACGGDGTASSLLDAMYRQRAPGVAAVIPLGTGNDMARALGWRPGRSLRRCLEAVRSGERVWLDRWLLTGPDIEVAWFNYCSLGCDARVALRFDRLRRQQPWMFRNPVTNKLIYAVLGGSEAGRPLAVRVLDERLPRWVRAVVWTSIASYGGGGDLGGGVAADDGLVDGFALGSGLMMGLGTHGPRFPKRLGARARWRFLVSSPAVLQTDGEARRVAAGRYTITHAGRVPAVRHAGEAVLAEHSALAASRG